MIYKKPVLNYLNSVIPKIVSTRELLTYAFLLGLSAYVFLLIFQPFGTYNFENAYKFSLLSGYGVILSIAYALISILLRKKRGTVAIELFRIFLVFLLSSFLNFVYHGWFINQAPLQWNNLPYMGCYTLSLYSPIATIYFLLRVDKRHSHHEKSNSSIEDLSIKPAMILSEVNDCHLGQVNIPNGNQPLKLLPSDFIFAKSMDNYCMIYFMKDGTVKKQMVRITLSRLSELLILLRVDKRHSHHEKSNSSIEDLSIKPAMILSEVNDCHLGQVNIPNGNQPLKLLPSDFIFAKSMDNYCMIYFMKDGTVKKQMVRITLSRLSELLNTMSIHRCHRSFLVNFEKIIAKEGNAQGLLLRFADTEDCAVISRSAMESVRPYL